MGLMCSAKNAAKLVNNQASDWSGSLTYSDFLDVLDGIQSKSGNSVLHDYVMQRSSEYFHMDARFIIDLVDNCNGNNIINQLRKKLPNFFDSSKEVKDELSRLKGEFETILRPVQTTIGYRVDPNRLLKCLRYLYYFVPQNNQLWKIWGDAREMGAKKLFCCSMYKQ